MPEELKIKRGTKLQVAFSAPLGTEPKFDMICTFQKALDSSAFLMSVPLRGGKPLELDERQKLLICYGSGSSKMFLEGYADDLVQDGIRRYWRIRRVAMEHQFYVRADERLKVALHLKYKQSTWPVNSDGVILPEDGLSIDISNGGIAFFLPHHFEVGEVCELSFPRVGTAPEGRAIDDVIGGVSWCREAPKGSPYRFMCGLRFRFAEQADKQTLVAYVANIKKKYAL